MTHRWNILGVAVVLGLAGLAGCTNNNRTDTAAERTGAAAKERAKDTAYAGDRTADRTGKAADNTANKVEKSLENAGAKLTKNANEMAMTAKVKNAMMTTKQQLDWTGIDVDTDKGYVHLKGVVPNAQQKKLAEKIAKQAAGQQFKVMSHLQVSKGQ